MNSVFPRNLKVNCETFCQNIFFSFSAIFFTCYILVNISLSFTRLKRVGALDKTSHKFLCWSSKKDSAKYKTVCFFNCDWHTCFKKIK